MIACSVVWLEEPSIFPATYYEKLRDSASTIGANCSESAAVLRVKVRAQAVGHASA